MVISTSYNERNNPIRRQSIFNCRFFCTLCCLIFCFFVFFFGLLFLYVGLSDGQFGKGVNCLVGFIILEITLYLCKRLCPTLKQYSLTARHRRQHVQRSQQHENNLTLSSNNNNENLELVTNGITDLPSYRELFPYGSAIRNNGNHSSSVLLPPSYDDFVQRPDIHHQTTTRPISSLHYFLLSIPSTPLSLTSSSQTSVNIRSTIQHV
ncbi:unnamed protein product [Adineta steineri]|uniref:Uncharacterized protein n=1 Tax=Adineta steineri TaxID=433720 RepID=A0A815PH62_9BILA|nr:unnamed protein product [Adineta steineri]CAF1629998.1 unnamed protein product [Adineta steineri]